MERVIVAMPKIEDAIKISKMLKARGLEQVETGTTGSEILAKVHQLDSGVVICTRSLKDMHYRVIAESLPDYFEMILLTTGEGPEDCPPNIVTLSMPLRMSELLQIVEDIQLKFAQQIRKKRGKIKKRNKEEQDFIDQVKRLLMEKNCMTEPEAFRYIQKCSMDSCNGMYDTAQMIWALQGGGG